MNRLRKISGSEQAALRLYQPPDEVEAKLPAIGPALFLGAVTLWLINGRRFRIWSWTEEVFARIPIAQRPVESQQAEDGSWHLLSEAG